MSAPVCPMCLHKKSRHTLPGGKCNDCTSPGADLGCKYEWPKTGSPQITEAKRRDES